MEKLKQPVNLAEQVYQELRKEIIEGKIEKGRQLTELSLSKAMGVSRTPVREAMKQLEAEGLIELRPNRGAVVLGIETRDFRDIYEIRSLLEGRAAEKAALNADEDRVNQLMEITDLTEFYIERGDYERVTVMDDRFHALIYEMTNSRILQKILTDLHAYAESIRERSIKEPGRAVETLKEHRAILEAISEKDEKKAGMLMSCHIQNAAANIQKNHLADTFE